MTDTQFIIKSDGKVQDPTDKFHKVAVETDDGYEFGVMNTMSGEFASLLSTNEEDADKQLQKIIDRETNRIKNETTKVYKKVDNHIEEIRTEDV
jgi:hypothetical protein